MTSGSRSQLAEGRRALIVFSVVGQLCIACGGESAGETATCRSAWREISLPTELASFHAGAAVVLDGRSYVFKSESELLRTAAPVGFVFEPPDKFTFLSDEGAPSLVGLAAVVPVSGEIVVLTANGTYEGDPGSVSYGARYSVGSNTWSSIPPIASRVSTMGVSEVGDGVLVEFMSSLEPEPAYEALVYRPADESWSEVTAAPEPIFSRSAVWTGTEAILWGEGVTGSALALRYDARTDSWAQATERDAPPHGAGATLVWTGEEAIVWGGSFDAPEQADVGARYDPERDAWEPTSAMGAALGRRWHRAIAVGRKMIVWGGQSQVDSRLEFRNDGGIYDAETDVWNSIPSRCGPEPREDAIPLWIDTGLVVWGGRCGNLPDEQCQGRAWYVPEDVLFGNVYDDPDDCSCPRPLGE